MSEPIELPGGRIMARLSRVVSRPGPYLCTHSSNIVGWIIFAPFSAQSASVPHCFRKHQSGDAPRCRGPWTFGCEAV